MELPHSQRFYYINPLVAGKIIKYSENKNAFLKELEDCQSLTVEAYRLILEWYEKTGGEVPLEECNLLYNPSKFWDNLENKYHEIDAECQYNVLKILKICTVIDPRSVLALTFVSEELRVDAFEMVVQGCLLQKSDWDRSWLIEYIANNKMIDLLIESDKETLRVTILRNLSLVFDELPMHNPVMEKFRKFLVSGQDSCILEILLFLLKSLLKSSMEDVQKLIPEVIYRGCESQDESLRRKALHSLKHYIDFQQNCTDAKEEEISSFCYLITILSSVEQHQSHLICPAIKMLPRTEGVSIKWQKLLMRSLLGTQNKLILKPVLEYLISRDDFNFLIRNLLPKAFSALNQSTIHREESEICRQFCRKAFIWNWRVSLEDFAEVSWLVFPLYSILTYITKGDEYFGDLDHVDGLGLIFRKIIGNIYGLQTDHLTKRTILSILLKFIESVKQSLKEEDRMIILGRIMESSPKDDELLENFKYGSNCRRLISKVPLLQGFNENIRKILDQAKDLEERNLMELAELIDAKRWVVTDEQIAEFLNKFHGYSFGEKFLILHILKSCKKNIKLDHCHGISFNLSENEPDGTCSRKFKVIYDKVLFEIVFQVIEQFRKLPNATQPVDSDSILEIIGRRLECGEDFCNTMFLFKYLNFYTLPLEDKEIIERLLDLSYKELMAYRGKSEFSMYCSTFIDCFPTTQMPISKMIKQLLHDISLNSPEITKAIGEKLALLNAELLADLLSSREGVVDALFLRKNSPLRDLQFAIVEFAVTSEMYNDVLEELVKKYHVLSKTKAMYYPNSQHHLTKLRIIQGIAAIMRHRNIWRPECLDFLLNEANQPSILYILELIVVQTIPDESITQLIEMLKTTKNLKMHSAQSIFCILYLLCRKKNCPDFCRMCLNAIFPWTMGQNFSCRLYAQIAILKIHKLIPDNLIQPHEKYITESVLFSFNELSGNPQKNMERLEKDFRFNCLNASCLLSSTYIFRDIPRITGVAESEIVSYCEGEEDLRDTVHPWQEKQVSTTITSVQETYENIQTKIVPPVEFGHGDEKKSSGLIVCASLVDNYPNLGGLARTCEIFGVQRLILNSLRDAENSQFLALSMSAEKWLMLEEVKKWQVIAFCSEMKRQGYTIIGAEQTSRSIKLSEVTFPERSILVLGHEKEGLPADVIANLDIVVEIPQIGRLRSLNVHVTGSIFIYEYAKQHLI